MLRPSEYEQLTEYFLAFHQEKGGYRIANGFLYYVKPEAYSEFKKFKKNNGMIFNKPKDINMALISRGYPKNISRKNDVLVRLFNELTAYDSNLKAYIPELTESAVRETLDELSMRVKSKVITEFIMNGYNSIH